MKPPKLCDNDRHRITNILIYHLSL